MAYGNNKYSRNRKYSNSRSRGINKKKVAVPKTKKRAKDYTASNARAINSLSRSIAKLKMSQYGRIQQNLQTANGPITPTANYPVLFDATDFSCFRSGPPAAQGCQMWQYNALGQLTTTGGFNIQDNLGNPYWENQNNDIVDGGCFFPTYVKYFIDVQGLPSLDNTRVRFDFFSVKSSSQIQSTTSANLVTLPTGLQHLDNMATPHLNRINPIFFKRYLTKTIFINSTKGDPNTKGTTGNIHKFSVVLRPKKPRYQAISTPNTPNDPDLATPELATSGQYGPYNVPTTAPLWCLVSTDDLVASVSDRVQVTISRKCIWRDSIGSAKLQ